VAAVVLAEEEADGGTAPPEVPTGVTGVAAAGGEEKEVEAAVVVDVVDAEVAVLASEVAAGRGGETEEEAEAGKDEDDDPAAVAAAAVAEAEAEVVLRDSRSGVGTEDTSDAGRERAGGMGDDAVDSVESCRAKPGVSPGTAVDVADDEDTCAPDVDDVETDDDDGMLAKAAVLLLPAVVEAVAVVLLSPLTVPVADDDEAEGALPDDDDADAAAGTGAAVVEDEETVDKRRRSSALPAGEDSEGVTARPRSLAWKALIHTTWMLCATSNPVPTFSHTACAIRPSLMTCEVANSTVQQRVEGGSSTKSSRLSDCGIRFW